MTKYNTALKLFLIFSMFNVAVLVRIIETKYDLQDVANISRKVTGQKNAPCR